MGNRAVVEFRATDSTPRTALYLHWNGGRDSIESLLEATKRISNGGPSSNIPRFIQCACTLLDGGLSVYMDKPDSMDRDNGDNGVYYIDAKTLEIVGREFPPQSEQQSYDVNEFADYIVAKIGAASAFDPDKEKQGKKRTLHTYSDPSHGWVKVAISDLELLGIADKVTPFSYIRGDYAYLEEDCDASLFMDAVKKHDWQVTLKGHTSNNPSRIRSYNSYTYKGGK